MNDQDTGWVTITLRLRPLQLEALDSIVERRKAKQGRASRQSVVEGLVDRAIQDARRDR